MVEWRTTDLLTTLLRATLVRTLRPFVFHSTDHSAGLDIDVPHLGAYVHVPFCESLCPFCPYHKVAFGDGRLMPSYLDAVEREIDATLAGKETRLTSVYFGGGSPALAGSGIGRILTAIRRHAEIDGGVGVELHPRDVNHATVEVLRDAGVTMVSLGVQSFDPDLLVGLGRLGDPAESEAALKMLAAAGFDAVDVDLIFGIPGQDGDALTKDFGRAVALGATQVSAYPFIEFSYTELRQRPAPERHKRKLMADLLSAAGANGFERGSVWTFWRKGTPAYSSVTRDNFIGFGPSATTLLRDQFKVNIFDVTGYAEAVMSGGSPTAYTLRFSPRSRQAYWLFWSCYNMDVRRRRFRELFGEDLDGTFGGSLRLACRLGIAANTEAGYTLTSRGAYLYHVIEQIYTHQYIERTWRASMAPVPPRRIVLW